VGAARSSEFHGVQKSIFWNMPHKKKKCQKTTIIIMATKDEEIAMISTAANAGSISVMAPSDMPGGYEFFADAGNGSSYKVRVVRTEAIEERFVFDMFNA
jgi:hypothetical protein